MAVGPVSRILSAIAGVTVIPLRRPLLDACSDLPGTSIHCWMPIRVGTPSRHAAGLLPHRPLFGLAPCGVCHATAITGRPVVSYTTFSPLPLRAVSSLWHFPSSDLDATVPDVIRHTALWSSDFPPVGQARQATVRSNCQPAHYIRFRNRLRLAVLRPLACRQVPRNDSEIRLRAVNSRLVAGPRRRTSSSRRSAFLQDSR
jgi:hypothetical protein